MPFEEATPRIKKQCKVAGFLRLTNSPVWRGDVVIQGRGPLRRQSGCLFRVPALLPTGWPAPVYLDILARRGQGGGEDQVTWFM